MSSCLGDSWLERIHAANQRGPEPAVSRAHAGWLYTRRSHTAMAGTSLLGAGLAMTNLSWGPIGSGSVRSGAHTASKFARMGRSALRCQSITPSACAPVEGVEFGAPGALQVLLRLGPHQQLERLLGAAQRACLGQPRLRRGGIWHPCGVGAAWQALFLLQQRTWKCLSDRYMPYVQCTCGRALHPTAKRAAGKGC